MGVHLAGEIYSIDLDSGETQLFANGLDGVLDLKVPPQSSVTVE